MIKAIIFDCFGVLTTDHWKEFCAELPPGAVVNRAKSLNHTYDAGLITSDEFVEDVYKLTGRKFTNIDVRTGSITDKNVELLRYIAKLKPMYKIGLLSNIASNWIRDTFLTSEEQKLFDDMVMSFEVGMTKPNPEIFALACKRLGSDPKETVMVDDINHYCSAANTAGLQAITYKNFAQMKQELEILLADPNN